MKVDGDMNLDVGMDEYNITHGIRVQCLTSLVARTRYYHRYVTERMTFSKTKVN